MQCTKCQKQLCCDRKSRNQKLYCSSQCLANHRHEQYIERWLKGLENGMRGKTLLSCHIRRWLFEQRGESCWVCQWDTKHPSSGKCPLEVDHIDGTHTNNRPENLRLLCPNCHALTPTYRNRNKGNGRKHRRDLYNSGKSY